MVDASSAGTIPAYGRNPLEAADAATGAMRASRSLSRLRDAAAAGDGEGSPFARALDSELEKAAARAPSDEIAHETGADHTPERSDGDARLREACYEMESIYLGYMLRAMRNTIDESDFFGGSIAKDVFRDMLYDEYAKIMARTDQLGIARQIYTQLSGH